MFVKHDFFHSARIESETLHDSYPEVPRFPFADAKLPQTVATTHTCLVSYSKLCAPILVLQCTPSLSFSTENFRSYA
jgi:hypothetical protein